MSKELFIRGSRKNSRSLHCHRFQRCLANLSWQHIHHLHILTSYWLHVPEGNATESLGLSPSTLHKGDLKVTVSFVDVSICLHTGAAPNFHITMHHHSGLKDKAVPTRASPTCKMCSYGCPATSGIPHLAQSSHVPQHLFRWRPYRHI